MCKIDSLASKTTLYYNNPDRQVLEEYDVNDNFTALYAYGNYIDGVLYSYSVAPPPDYSYSYYYIHDHLYSPAALVDASTGTVLERYEYDVYGEPTIRDTEYEPRATSQYGNAYFFTGRRLDLLDGGNLKLQYNRNRYYDYYIGRWFTHDPRGITPAPSKTREFDVSRQISVRSASYFAAACKDMEGVAGSVQRNILSSELSSRSMVLQ